MFASYEDCIAAETDVLVVADGIRAAQQLANCNRDTAYIEQAWGQLNRSLLQVISTHLRSSRGWSARKANASARVIVDTMHDCGENVRYCLALLDNGTITA